MRITDCCLLLLLQHKYRIGNHKTPDLRLSLHPYKYVHPEVEQRGTTRVRRADRIMPYTIHTETN